MIDKNLKIKPNNTQNPILIGQVNNASISIGNSPVSNAQELPHFGRGITFFSPSAKITDPQQRQMYKDIEKILDDEGKSNLEILLKTGKLLLNKNTPDGTNTLQNLHKIISEPRAEGLDAVKILNQTLKTIVNPFIITQNFGKIPDLMVGKILADPNINKVTGSLNLNNQLAPHFTDGKFTSPSVALTPEDLNVVSSGTCVAASIEFNLASNQPDEYVRYAAALTSPANEVNDVIKFGDLSPSMTDAIDLMNQFGLKYKPLDWEKAEVSLKPDENAIIRARAQSANPQPGTRSIIDTLFQSTFMQIGSANSYNSLTDKRHGGFNTNDKGLTEFEKTFTESIVDNNGEKLSMTYQDVDDNAYLKGYTTDSETVKKQLLDSLDCGSNVIIGITETDNTNKIIGGHEITLIGSRVDKNGELYFTCNDTDDNFEGAIEIKAKDLIPKIHHAGIPAKVLGPQKLEDRGYVILKDYQNMRKNLQKPQLQQYQYASLS